ncbi:sigma-70 family RNA polymerase sigma factor [Solirubrobacter sp. CPCC 204708]|uniref:Sigma-70 family RNA polymerase sigma factor n=1 Tax=Solirubrobacter deserti TaxID=2282478 RepID=A0ABT4RC26_9ACTN|nr:sigma-70 family RNA polymerase sigma factor [Solirubrobacter deserti]MBE2317030.1 sigma-70 family RNA polymerase sigma factor [Solirubrobacter deserti]MDA0136078.1 sigma-70 family RNA polymerase sigma factor [Solirubrobacter deserti]
MGDPEIVTALYKQHFEPLRRRAQSITRCPHAAQDAAQDALLATLARLDLDDPGFGAYATTVARRNALRHRAPLATGPDRPQEDHSTAVVCRADVRRALSALPERQRRAVFLSTYADQPHEAVGAALGLTPNATGQLLFRARSALQSSLEAS